MEAIDRATRDYGKPAQFEFSPIPNSIPFLEDHKWIMQSLRISHFIIFSSIKMSRRRSSLENQSRFEPPKKKRKSHRHDKKPKITKETLIKALLDVEDEVRALKHDSLAARLKDLRGQVKVVLERHKDEIKRLHAKIDKLREEVENLKAKNDDLSNENKELMNKLNIAQATWAWEAHLARFVVDNSKEIYKFSRFKQMNHHLTNVRAKDNLWIKIKRNVAQWTRKHWDMINTVRDERNGIAHPNFIDLDLIYAELNRIFPEYRQPMLEMLDILKTTASLMKFGRLTKFYRDNKDVFPKLTLDDTGESVLKDIISWDRQFEDIDGLQHVKHEDAKKYLAKYVNDPEMIDHYFRVVDFVKDGNIKRMGRLAWDLGKRHSFTRRMTVEEREVVNTLKRLVSKTKRTVVVLDPTIAKLHIPDFLPKRLWKHGIKIVEKCF